MKKERERGEGQGWVWGGGWGKEGGDRGKKKVIWQTIRCSA